MKSGTLFVSKLLTAKEVKANCQKFKQYYSEGKELEANIVMLRIAGKKGGLNCQSMQSKLKASSHT